MARTASHVVPAATEAIKKRIKESDGRRLEYRIAGHPGLVLTTQKSGGGIFYLFYTPQNGGKRRKLKLGTFPATTLKTAASMALETRARIDRGEDPVSTKVAEKKSRTFEALARQFVAESPVMSGTSRESYLTAYVADVFPHIGNKPAVAVTPDDIIAICQRIKARGRISQAQHVKSYIGGLYRWAISEGYAKTNPAKAVPNQQAFKGVRTRTPTDDEIAAVWRNLSSDAVRASHSIRILIKLTILTAQRRKEVAGARVSELAGDTWIIPGDVKKAGRIASEGRMKNGTEQRVYLSTQARALFDEARRSTAVGDMLFPCDTRRTRAEKTRFAHVHPDSVTKAMMLICEEAKVEGLTLHDFRRAAATFLKNAGYSRDVRDLVLHHKDSSVTGTHYDASATMEPQCRAAWQDWADHVSKICSLTGHQVEAV